MQDFQLTVHNRTNSIDPKAPKAGKIQTQQQNHNQGCSRSIDLGEKDQDLLIELDILGDLDHHQ